MRGIRTIVAVNLFVGFFGTADHHLLIGNAHAIKLLEVVLPALHKYVAAARIDAILNHRHFTAGLFPRRVFSTVDKAAQIALFNPAKAVNLFFDINRCAKSGQGRLSDRKIQLMLRGQNVD